MNVDALFFAAYRDLVGREHLSVRLPEGATADTLVQTLRARGEPFSRLPAVPALAVNRRYVSGDHVLHPDDEVAFIPPVAGG